MSGLSSEMSSLAVRTISDGGHGGLRTSSAVLRALGQAADAEEQARRPVENVDPDGGVWTTKKPVKDAGRRRKLALGVTVLVIAAVAVIAWAGMMAISFFQDDPPSGPPVNLADETSTQQSDGQDGGDGSQQSGRSLGDPAEVSGIEVYNPEGEGDAVDEASYAVDGDPATAWATDEYRQQFPAFKSGVGLIAEFAEPVDLGAVRIVADSPGTEVEIRAADSADPDLSDTEVVASGPLEGQRTELALSEPVSTRYVIVWVTTLSGEEPEYTSQLSELMFLPLE